MITLEQLTLSGKPCDHTIQISFGRTTAFNDSICSLCGISYEQREDQWNYKQFLFRSVIKKLDLKWETIKDKVSERDVSAAFLYDFEYKAMEGIYEKYTRVGDKEVTRYKKLVVVDMCKDSRCLYEHYADCSYNYDHRAKTPETREIEYLSMRSSSSCPTDRQLHEIINWACAKDPKIEDYVLNVSTKEFFKVKSKKEVAKKTATITNSLAKADKFNYTEQLTISNKILNEKARADLLSVGIHVNKAAYFNFREYVNLSYKWTGPKAYILNIKNDETLDLSGRKLYEAIIDLLGKEKGDEYIATSLDRNFKRLSVCMLDNAVIGLIEDDSRVRLAAEKIIKKNKVS